MTARTPSRAPRPAQRVSEGRGHAGTPAVGVSRVPAHRGDGGAAPHHRAFTGGEPASAFWSTSFWCWAFNDKLKSEFTFSRNLVDSS